MGDNSSQVDAECSSQATSKSRAGAIKPSHWSYGSVLFRNNIRLDPAGYEMDSHVRTTVEEIILKARDSPTLSPQVLKDTVLDMDSMGRSTESVVSGLLSSAMFPVKEKGLGYGGNSPWSISVLPKLPFTPISIPKPDYQVGYDIHRTVAFSNTQVEMICHPDVRRQIILGTGNVLPFLIVEMKSEATGGTLLHAEHQAAGSGTCAVAATKWLFEQVQFPNAPDGLNPVDSVAFSIAATGRLVVVSVHWFSATSKLYFMSKVKSFVTSEEKDPYDEDT